MKKYFLLSVLTVIVFYSFGFKFQPGDLLFQTEGTSELSAAISSATAQNDSLKFIHVAMVYAADPIDTLKVRVIEASPKKGVTTVSLEDFVSSSATIDGKPGVVVKRLKFNFPKDSVITRALSMLGLPYDWSYLPDNDMVYCSELIYESFLTEDGQHIFSSKPMNFRNSDGTMPEYWTRLYQKLGIDVPEGIPGTNPTDMSKDPVLEEVFRYF